MTESELFSKCLELGDRPINCIDINSPVLLLLAEYTYEKEIWSTSWDKVNRLLNAISDYVKNADTSLKRGKFIFNFIKLTTSKHILSDSDQIIYIRKDMPKEEELPPHAPQMMLIGGFPYWV